MSKTWTTERPREIGFYWLRGGHLRDRVEVCRVYLYGGYLKCATWKQGGRALHPGRDLWECKGETLDRSDHWDVTKYNEKWAGKRCHASADVRPTLEPYEWQGPIRPEETT